MGLTYKALKYRDIKMNMSKAKAAAFAGLSENVVVSSSEVQQTSAIANDACSMLIDETTATTTTTADNQQQFTADHIMQLCLFLAEKSRAKQLQQQQEMSARRYYENFLKEANDLSEDEKVFKDNDCHTLPLQTHTNVYSKLKSPTLKQNIITSLQTSPRAPRREKLKSAQNLKQNILADKLSKCTTNNNNNNTANLSYNSLFNEATHETSTQHNHQQQHSQQQDKRDILMKIRQQIFERKRLRQVLCVGQQQNCQYQQQQQHRLDYDMAPFKQQQNELQQLTDVWRPW